MDRTGDVVRGLAFATALACIAGMVDAIGFLRLGHVFVSYMSGNTTQFAVDLGRGNSSEAGAIAGLVGLFVAGAAAGQVLAHASGRWHLSVVLALVTVLLGVAAAMATAPPPMVVAMGALNAAMHRAGNLGISLTYVTGTLVKFGQGLGDLLVAPARRWDWLAQSAPWFGIVAGAVAAGTLYSRMGDRTLWLAAAGVGIAAVASVFLPAPD